MIGRVEVEGDVLWWLKAVSLNHLPGWSPTLSWGAWIKTGQPEQSIHCFCWETTGGRHILNLWGVCRGPLHSSYKQMELWLRNVQGTQTLAQMKGRHETKQNVDASGTSTFWKKVFKLNSVLSRAPALKSTTLLLYKLWPSGPDKLKKLKEFCVTDAHVHLTKHWYAPLVMYSSACCRWAEGSVICALQAAAVQFRIVTVCEGGALQLPGLNAYMLSRCIVNEVM